MSNIRRRSQTGSQAVTIKRGVARREKEQALTPHPLLSTPSRLGFWEAVQGLPVLQPSGNSLKQGEGN